jgi:prevent-host-death family protein
MMTNLRDAKSRFSELVKRAAEGEEILITVRGEPLAKLTGVSARCGRPEDRANWIVELADAAAREATGVQAKTPQTYWDETRSGR